MKTIEYKTAKICRLVSYMCMALWDIKRYYDTDDITIIEHEMLHDILLQITTSAEARKESVYNKYVNKYNETLKTFERNVKDEEMHDYIRETFKEIQRM